VHGLHAGGEWAVQFPAYQGVKFDAVSRGSCWLTVQGEQPFEFQEGDVFLLTRGTAFSLASHSHLTPVDCSDAIRNDSQGVGYIGEETTDTFIIGGHFLFEGDYEAVLFDNLPAMIPVSGKTSESAVLRWALELFAAEIQSDAPGSSLTAAHLANIMLIQVLRLYQRSTSNAGRGLFSALGDKRLTAALCAMHSEVNRSWTLENLAKTAGMSRSNLAVRFKSAFGRGPLEYLARWRMQIAGDRLRSTTDDIGSIARSVGYKSEAGFSNAFKRFHGNSPRTYRYANTKSRVG